jgi:hypothetical protein
MLFTRITFAAVLLLGAVAVAPATARAQSPHRLAQGDTSSRAALIAERQRVRGELEKANADVDALKRSGRGLREEYRLRERLADAEALARRLTELDARLGGGAAPATRGPGAEPRVSAADGPAEREAKADILADQAQRLAARGDALLGRARDLRARQTLRRRVVQMERDPFSPLEGSKRRAMTGSVAVAGSPSTAGRAVPPAGVQTDKAGDSTGNGATTPATTQAPPPPGAALGPATSVATPGASQPGATNPAVGAPTGSAVSSPTSAPAPTSGSEATSLSVQLRDLLDPTTLAEIQHLEATGGAGTSFEALERAGAALKARADRLRQQATSLRATEHEPPRAR